MSSTTLLVKSKVLMVSLLVVTGQSRRSTPSKNKSSLVLTTRLTSPLNPPTMPKRKSSSLSSINPGPTPLRSPANKTPALVLSSVETLKLPVKPLTPNPTLNSKPPSTPVSPASKTTNSKVNSSLIAVWSMSKSKSLLVLTMTLSSLSLTATITARLLNASAISLPAASMVKSPLPPSTELNIWFSDACEYIVATHHSTKNTI
mmetsp:Transcript_14526/g.12334  ORF Transcript_14526/g.12334 Transcript_14526/m.12334 type:complete len:203 (-) Transcript_14526:135-743(-)